MDPSNPETTGFSQSSALGTKEQPHGPNQLIPRLKRELIVPAICGMAASPVMVGLWALASVLRPAYDQLTQKGSEPGTSPSSMVMNTKFVVPGLPIVIVP